MTDCHAAHECSWGAFEFMLPKLGCCFWRAKPSVAEHLTVPAMLSVTHHRGRWYGSTKFSALTRSQRRSLQSISRLAKPKTAVGTDNRGGEQRAQLLNDRLPDASLGRRRIRLPGAASNNQLCCRPRYPPALDEVLAKAKSFQQLEDFNRNKKH